MRVRSRAGDIVRRRCSPQAAREWVGDGLALVISPISYNRVVRGIYSDIVSYGPAFLNRVGLVNSSFGRLDFDLQVMPGRGVST